MASGALLGATCYASSNAAQDAFYSAAAPVHVPGATSYVSTFVKASGTWFLRRYQIDSDGSTAILGDAALMPMTFPECDPREAFMDGMTVGWGVVLAMVATWAVAVMRRGL